MTDFTAATDSFIVGTFPRLTAQLAVGDDVTGVVGGRLVSASVVDVGQTYIDRGFRLLTGVGDIVIAASVPVTTDLGPQPPVVIRDRVARGEMVRLEIVAPTPARRCKPACGSSQNSHGWLASIEPAVVQLPISLVMEDAALIHRVRQALDEGAAAYSESVTDRWYFAKFEASPGEVQLCGCRASQIADELLAFTAWELGGISRTLMGETVARRLLLAALAASGEAFDVKWTPGYFPVEARTTRTGGAWPAYTNVTLVEEVEAEFVTFELKEKCSLIVGLAVCGALV